MSHLPRRTLSQEVASHILSVIEIKNQIKITESQSEFLTLRFGCGNNVHIKCMKVWADHQKSNGEAQLKCPLCRETFCSYELLEKEFRNNGLFKLEKPDLHYGITCSSCNSTPINGKCYKCTTCKEFYMCQACFNTDTHTKHAFVFREAILPFRIFYPSFFTMISMQNFLENKPEIPQSNKRSCRHVAHSDCAKFGYTRNKRPRL